FLHTFGLLLLERRLADEVALRKLHEPREICLERSDGFVDVVTVERHAHLEPQRVARAESGRSHLAGGHEGLPDGKRRVVVDVELEAVFAGVAGARNNCATSRKLTLGEMIVADR